MRLFDRHPLDDYDPDRFGTWWDDRDRQTECLPRGGRDELLRRPLCPFCSKPIEARAACAACGDETDRVAA